MEARVKGTVTSLSSMFPVEEAQKASQRMHETIAEKHKELDKLDRFTSDNTNLINIVQRLPDELHHQIMVPFGKAAFFPGRLVHTNEFLVLLGEGYYAERTAKSTVDILKRRGKTLESQVNSLKVEIKDLQAEASFFDRTAAEATEGLVEIREECSDEDEECSDEYSSESVSKSGPQKSLAPSASGVDSGTGTVDDDEYALIMSRFDELEREELEAEDNQEQDDDEHDEDSDNLDADHSRDQGRAKGFSNISLADDADKLYLGKSSLQSGQRDESAHGKGLIHTYVSKPAEKDNMRSSAKTNIHSAPKSKYEVPADMPKQDAGSRMSRPVTDSLKAFTGSIIERTDNLQINSEKQTNSQPSNSQPSRPVSRFKMQRK